MDGDTTLIELPAFCRRCGKPFASGFAGGDNATIFMTGATSGPCPHCGYPIGDVPDGGYQFVNGALGYIRELNPTQDDLRATLQELLQAIREQATDVEAIRNRLDEQAPSAAPLMQLVRDPAVGHVIAAMALLAAVIFGILSQN